VEFDESLFPDILPEVEEEEIPLQIQDELIPEQTNHLSTLELYVQAKEKTIEKLRSVAVEVASISRK